MIRVVIVTIVLVALARRCDSADAATQAPGADSDDESEADDPPSAHGRGLGSKTAVDRSDQRDIDITVRIRKAIIRGAAFSMAAKDVKIITASGVVTLRGPVRSEGEKLEIGKLALTTAGVRRVDNLLEIATE